MATPPHDAGPDAPAPSPAVEASGVAARQRRARRWVAALTAVVVAVPVGITVQQVTVHGTAFFVCRPPAVGATAHRAPECPKP
ncbi:MAG TPA: hypothetical protein VMU09_13495 [Acidimicrobiales bacterium]|nr:hypothetical protein [Acidimicrobiales bacterium]